MKHIKKFESFSINYLSPGYSKQIDLENIIQDRLQELDDKGYAIIVNIGNTLSQITILKPSHRWDKNSSDYGKLGGFQVSDIKNDLVSLISELEANRIVLTTFHYKECGCVGTEILRNNNISPDVLSSKLDELDKVEIITLDIRNNKNRNQHL